MSPEGHQILSPRPNKYLSLSSSFLAPSSSFFPLSPLSLPSLLSQMLPLAISVPLGLLYIMTGRKERFIPLSLFSSSLLSFAISHSPILCLFSFNEGLSSKIEKRDDNESERSVSQTHCYRIQVTLLPFPSSPSLLLVSFAVIPCLLSPPSSTSSWLSLHHFLFSCVPSSSLTANATPE